MEDSKLHGFATSSTPFVNKMRGHTERVNCIVTYICTKTYAGYCVSGSDDTTVRIWSLEDLAEVAILTGHSSKVECVDAIAERELIASGGQDNTVCLWHMTSHLLLFTLKGHSDHVNGICHLFVPSICADSHVLCTGSRDRTIIVWNTSNGEVVMVLKGAHTAAVNCVAGWSKEDADMPPFVFSGSNDNNVVVWNLASGEVLQCLKGHTWAVVSLSVYVSSGLCHPLVVSASTDGSMIIWHTELGQIARRLQNYHVGYLRWYYVMVLCVIYTYLHLLHTARVVTFITKYIFSSLRLMLSFL